jgi:aspartyl-tRNA(Asn)/glutamyl-tRNA(Gln) amidotransferase subunit B
MNYEPVIGLEVHIHLNTKSKAFCSCSTEFGKPPNSQVCPVCLGFPGSLPVLNQTALDHAIKVGLALNCTVQEFTKFDRKHYYYPDLPKNYQISQYDLPVSVDGYLDIEVEGKSKRIRIKRAHLEEDAGKLIHSQDKSLVDYNRAGVPLLEIVTEPDINSPQEAYEYLTRLKSLVEYLDVSDCDMEKGSLRCDANISIRPAGTKGLGTKAELKNMNSFKGVKDALEYEAQRQVEAKESGEEIVQETRLWDAKELKTVTMRTKEEAKDYRYFPEPDLTPFIIKKEKIEQIRSMIPELPQARKKRFIQEYGLSDYDAGILVASRKNAEFSETAFKLYAGKDKKTVANWMIGPMLAAATPEKPDFPDLNLTPAALVELITFVDDQKISNLSAKSVLSEMVSCGKPAGEIIKEKNLAQVSDEGALLKDVDAAIAENPKVVLDFKSGKENSIMFLVGQVMKKSKGKANPKVVQDILKRRLLNA